jgi:hypothetical protein
MIVLRNGLPYISQEARAVFHVFLIVKETITNSQVIKGIQQSFATDDEDVVSLWHCPKP